MSNISESIHTQKKEKKSVTTSAWEWQSRIVKWTAADHQLIVFVCCCCCCCCCLFRMFCSACFVPDVLLQSGHPPPTSPPVVPMERCQPTPLSAARAPPALWDSRKVVWSGSRSLTVARSVWVVTAARPYRWRHKRWRWVTMTSTSSLWRGLGGERHRRRLQSQRWMWVIWNFIRKIPSSISCSHGIKLKF